MRTMTSLGLLLAALMATACVADDTDSTQRGVRGGDDEEGCKIEGDQIGRVGASVTVGSKTYVFEQWIPKADSPGEYVGFVLGSNAGTVHYVVKTGTERYEACGPTWDNPYGDEGPDAHGISNVDFCDPPPDCDCDYPPDGGDGGDGGGETPPVD